MLASHERALGTAQQRSEPAWQIAARHLEVSRIGPVLRRGEDLPSDVAAAIEAEAEGAFSERPDSLAFLHIQYFANFLCQRERRKRLLQKGLFRFDDAVAHDGVVGVAADK
jgi:hypothetical protein